MGLSTITWTCQWNRRHRKNSTFQKFSCTQFWIWNLWYGFLYPLDWFITGKIINSYHYTPFCRFITGRIIYSYHSMHICRFATGRIIYSYHSMHVCRFITGKIIYSYHSINKREAEHTHMWSLIRNKNNLFSDVYLCHKWPRICSTCSQTLSGSFCIHDLSRGLLIYSLSLSGHWQIKQR